MVRDSLTRTAIVNHRILPTTQQSTPESNRPQAEYTANKHATSTGTPACRTQHVSNSQRDPVSAPHCLSRLLSASQHYTAMSQLRNITRYDRCAAFAMPRHWPEARHRGYGSCLTATTAGSTTPILAVPLRDKRAGLWLLPQPTSLQRQIVLSAPVL